MKKFKFKIINNKNDNSLQVLCRFEYIVSILPHYKIIRAPFIRKIYPKVFTNQYCSRYFLDEVVEKITYNIINNPNNLIHISSERMSLYDL